MVPNVAIQFVLITFIFSMVRGILEEVGHVSWYVMHVIAFLATHWCTCFDCRFCHEGLSSKWEGGRGGHSHRFCVQSDQDAVKQSRHFLRVGQMVKQCSGHYYWRSRGVAELLHSSVGRWSTGQGKKFAVVKRSRPFFDSQKSWPWSQLSTQRLWECPPCLLVWYQIQRGRKRQVKLWLA